MNNKKIVISFIALTLLILGGGVYVLSATSTPAQITSSQNAKVEIPEKTFDWGNIPYSGGNVTKTFAIKINPSRINETKSSFCLNFWY